MLNWNYTSNSSGPWEVDEIKTFLDGEDLEALWPERYGVTTINVYSAMIGVKVNGVDYGESFPDFIPTCDTTLTFYDND